MLTWAFNYREGSGPLSYVLEKDDTGNSKEKWIPYKPSISDEVDLPLRREQLNVRVRESQQTLDFLFKLNNGNFEEESVLFSSVDIGLFKVTRPFRFQMHMYGGINYVFTGNNGSQYTCLCRSLIWICNFTPHIGR